MSTKAIVTLVLAASVAADASPELISCGGVGVSIATAGATSSMNMSSVHIERLLDKATKQPVTIEKLETEKWRHREKHWVAMEMEAKAAAETCEMSKDYAPTA